MKFIGLKFINLFKVLSKLNAKANAAGWVPSSLNRTAVSFSQQRPGVKPELQIRLATLGTQSTYIYQYKEDDFRFKFLISSQLLNSMDTYTHGNKENLSINSFSFFIYL